MITCENIRIFLSNNSGKRYSIKEIAIMFGISFKDARAKLTTLEHKQKIKREKIICDDKIERYVYFIWKIKKIII